MKIRTKLKQYPQTAQAKIDLHGFTREEAIREIYDFLTESAEKHRRKVQIITGKGAGVLQECAQQILREEGCHFANAKPNEGGSGTINVFFD